MGKRQAISILAVFLASVLMTSGLAAEKGGRILLRDGFALRGVEGKLIKQDPNQTSQGKSIGLLATEDAWFFEFGSAVSDGKGVLAVGTKLTLLPSATLEQMIADANDRPVRSYRLWAQVTQYRGNNFVFCNYFLPLSKARGSEGTIRPGGPDAAMS
jgi:hypothetical protein